MTASSTTAMPAGATSGADRARAPAVRDAAPCWCGASAWATVFAGPAFGLLRCPACGTYRLDPRPVGDAEEAEFYTDYYADGGAAARKGAARPPAGTGRFWRVAARVPGLAAPATVALDVGCGEGHLCADLLDAGWPAVHGVDLSRSRIARARAAYPGVAFHTSLDECPLAPASADLVVLDNVVEHLLDPPALLRELRPLLRPDGRLVVVTPNMRSGHFRLLGRRWTPELCPNAHVHLFTPDSMRRLLAAAGYEVAAEGSIQIPLHPARAWLGHLARRDVRELAWRGVQECGNLFARATGAGGMLFAVARPAGTGGRT